eukprot:GHUV01044455.1.p1 GENE.GHUV01044455.1~~GHUV01044455.1.p1  ORF type:complete len:253 (+),score=70.32 GHUV01044455.1:439-1197(+)
MVAGQGTDCYWAPWAGLLHNVCGVCRCELSDQHLCKHSATVCTVIGALYAFFACLFAELREMSRKADAEKRQTEQAAATMDSIEAAARKQYEADQAAAQAQAGKWVWNADSGYYYNATHRWYYDHKAGWYYGGDPVEWTQTPSIPSAAMFGTAPHEGGDAPQQTATSKAAPAAAASSRPASAANGAAAALPAGAKVVKKTVALPVHPQAGIGGHQMPVAGRIGGAKGVGASSGSAADDLKVCSDCWGRRGCA